MILSRWKMKISLKQNEFDHSILKKRIEQIKSINRRKIPRAIFLDRSPTVLQGGQISVLIRRDPFDLYFNVLFYERQQIGLLELSIFIVKIIHFPLYYKCEQ